MAIPAQARRLPRVRPASEGPEPSFGEAVAANFRLGRADQSGATQEAVEVDAYGPLVTTLVDMGKPIERYVAAARGSGSPVNRDRVWEDIVEARERDPKAFGGVAANREAFEEAALNRYKRRIATDSGVAGRGGIVPMLVGGMGAGLTDPVNLGAMLMTGGVSGGARTIGKVMLREAAVNVGVEAIQQPLIAAERKTTGRELTLPEVGINLVAAAGLGAGFAGTMHVGVPYARAGGRAVAEPIAAGVRKVDDTLGDIQAQAAERIFDALPERAQKRWLAAGRLDDRDLPDAAEAIVGRDNMTADERAAATVLRREAEIDAVNPYGASGAATSAHRDDVTAALARVLALRPAEPVRAGRAAVPPAMPGGDDAVFRALVVQESGGRRGIPGPPTKYGRAYGLTQVLDSTAQAEARKLGIEWRPDLMRGTSDEAAAYQLRIGRSYFAEGLRRYGGDVRKALMFYHGGPDVKLWGAKTHAYADEVMARAGRGDAPDSVLEADSRMAGQASERERVADALEAAREGAARLEAEAPQTPAVAAVLARDEPAVPEAIAIDVAKAVEPDALPVRTPAELLPSLRTIVADRERSLADIEGIAAELGTDSATVRDGLGLLVDRGTLRRNRTSGHFMRRPVEGPIDAIKFVARAGGLHPDGVRGGAAAVGVKGHNLGKGTRFGGRWWEGAGWDRFVPGAGPFLREKGMGLDEAGELLWEAGYFGPSSVVARPTETDVLDLLGGAVGGRRALPFDTDEPVARIDDDEAVWRQGQVDEASRAYGIDLDEAGSAAVERLWRADPDGGVDGALRAHIDEELDAVRYDQLSETDDLRYEELYDAGPRSLVEEGGAGGVRRDGQPFASGDARAEPAGGRDGPGDPRWEEDAARLAEWDDPHGRAADEQAADLVADLRVRQSPNLPAGRNGVEAARQEAVFKKREADRDALPWYNRSSRADKIDGDIARLEDEIARATEDEWFHSADVAQTLKEVSDLRALRDRAVAADEYDLEAGRQRAMLQMARGEINSDVADGHLSAVEAAQKIAEARTRGNAEDALDTLLREGEIDPAVAARQRQEAVLKAASPMRAAVDQEDTIGLELFDSSDQFGLRLDEDGDVVNPADLLAELDSDDAAIDAVRRALDGDFDDMPFRQIAGGSKREATAHVNELRERATDRAWERLDAEASGLVDPAPSRATTTRLRSALIDERAGRISGEHFVARVEGILEEAYAKSKLKRLRTATGDRLRGADFVRERLLKAQRQGDIDPETAQFAEWFAMQNPALLDDLGISVRELPEGQSGTRGTYNPTARLITLFKGMDESTTAVHEILHHTERMMPEAFQAAIRAEWAKRVARLAGSQSPAERAYGEAILKLAASPNAKAMDEALTAMPMSEAYQFINPSEFWAVNASELLARRHAAAGSVFARIRTWMAEMVQHVRGALRLSSDAPVLRAIDALVKRSDGSVEGGMLAQTVRYADPAPRPSGITVPALIAAKRIPEKHAGEVRALYDDLLAQYEPRMGADAAAAQATRDAVAAWERSVKADKRSTVLQAKAQMRILDDARRGYRGADPNGPVSGKAMAATLGWDKNARFANVEYRQRNIKQTAMGMMYDILAKHRANLLGQVRHREELDDMVRELFGTKTGNLNAGELADAWRQTSEMLRQRFNQAGGSIGKLDDWGLPQSHDALRVGAMAREDWIDTITPMLDRARMLDRQTLQPMSDARLRTVLADVYETIVSDGWVGRQPGAAAGGKALANTRAEHRVLAFKDADSWLAYNERFGQATPWDAMMGHVDAMARDTAMMEILGPNPAATVRWMKELVEKDAHTRGSLADRRAATKDVETIEKLYQVLTGEADKPINRTLALVGSSVRNWQAATKLGGAVVSSFSDEGTMALTRRFNGLSGARQLRQGLEALNPLNGGNSVAIRRAGIISDEFTGRASAAGRMTMDELSGGRLSDGVGRGERIAERSAEVTRRLADGTLRASGLNLVTQARREVMAQEFAATFAEHAGMRWTELAPELVSFFERYGLGRDAWETIRAVKPTRRSGYDAIWPDMIEDRAVRDRLFEGMLTEIDFAVPTGGLRQRGIVAGYKRGTWMGEAVRTAFQFKMFPVTVMAMHGARMLDRPGMWNKAKYATGFLAMTTLMGALSYQLSNLTKGKDPAYMGRNPDPDAAMWGWDFWWRAMLKGGGLGVYGDAVNMSTNSYGQSIGDITVGPGWSTAQNLSDLIRGRKVEREDGSKVRIHDAARFLQREVPGSSLWYGRLAWERLAIDTVAEAQDEGHEEAYRRLEQRAARDGNPYFARPGRGLDMRAPNLRNAVEPEMLPLVD